MTLIRGGCYFYASLWIKVILIIKYDFCVCQIFHCPFNRNLLHDKMGLEFSHHYKMKGLGCLINWYILRLNIKWLWLQWILILHYDCIELQSFLILYVFEPTMTEIITKHISQAISDTTCNNCWSCIWTQTTCLLSDQIIYIKKEFVGNLFSRPRHVKRKKLHLEFQLLCFWYRILFKIKHRWNLLSITSHSCLFLSINAIW